ncbi:hypothetical protein AB0J35_58885 [Nonomuraea angiospora]|uniref:hypothetical protein n=1 Tax=Nonomuraea angiospora TaxID=46172 RepID=UPI003434E89A
MKRFFTAAMLTSVTCLTLMASPAWAGSEKVIKYFPTRAACEKVLPAFKVMGKLTGAKYYCKYDPATAYKLIKWVK